MSTVIRAAVKRANMCSTTDTPWIARAVTRTTFGEYGEVTTAERISRSRTWPEAIAEANRLTVELAGIEMDEVYASRAARRAGQEPTA